MVLLQSPSTAAASASTPGSITLGAEPPTVTYGGQTMLRGRVSYRGGTGASRLLVVVSERVVGESSFSVSGTVLTDAWGRFALSVTPLQTTVFRAEVSVPAGEQSPPPLRAEILVEVRPLVQLRVPSRLWVGEEVTLSGRVSPQQVEGTAVIVQRHVSGSWETLTQTVTDGSSTFTTAWVPPRTGRVLLRAVVLTDDGRSAGVSRHCERRIRDPNPHHVPADIGRLIVIDHAAYRLYYYEQGRVVRDFPCVLGKRSTPTPIGKGFRIRRKRMDPGGANGARYLGYLGRIGIHGTDQPGLLRRFPRAFSHGCARLYNRDVIWLYDRVPIGTRVWNVRGRVTPERGG